MSFVPRTPVWTRRFQPSETLLARFGITLPNQEALEKTLREAQGRAGHAEFLNAAPGVTEYQAGLLLDHGLQAIASLDSRIAEAVTATGLLEAQDDYFNRKLRRGRDGLPHPPKDAPGDEANFVHLDGLAISACVSACTGAFDRVAAGAAFILGVDRPHRRADWGQLTDGRWRNRATAWAQDYMDQMAGLTADAPWWTYLNDLRNVLTHRPPTLTVRVMQPTHGNPLVPTLPRRPRSVLGELVIEAEHQPVTDSYLSEPAYVTLMGLARESAAAIDGACAILVNAWNQRLSDHTLTTLTAKQLHDRDVERPFSGFDPRDDFFSLATTMAVNPSDGRRLERFQSTYRSSYD